MEFGYFLSSEEHGHRALVDQAAATFLVALRTA